MTGKSLRAEAVRVAKGGQVILHGVDVALPAGRLSVVLGPNGAGKSTLLRALAGLEVPTSGTVSLATGEAVRGLTPLERARRIAWAGDRSDVPFAFTALETVLLGRYPWHQGAPTAKDRAAALTALSRLGVDSLKDRTLPTLSSGERQKVMLARALAVETPVLLLDEPCANLDVGAALRLLGLLVELAHEGRTVVLTLHDVALAHRFAQHAVCMKGGRVLAEGTADAVFTAPTLSVAFGVDAGFATSDSGRRILVVELPQTTEPSAKA